MNEKPKICLAIMCKNEEHCIENTLNSLYKHIDYWVICDTGSTDRTCEIIENFFKSKNIPGELHRDEWVGFDHNKSLMMERAQNKGDYIFHTDADDILVGDLDFRNTDVGYDCYFMKVKRGGSEWKAFNLFKGDLLWRFCGVAHTTIIVIGQNGYTSGDLTTRNFYVLGEGIGSRSFDPKKYFYDAEKLQKQFFDTLYDDPYGLNNRSVFYTAQSYMDCDMWKEGLMWNRLYTKIKDTWIEEHFEAQMRISKCMMSLGFDNESIISEMRKAWEIFPERAETYHLLGCHLNNHGYYELGHEYLKIAKEKNFDDVINKYILFLDPYSYGVYNNHQLIISSYNLNKINECLTYIKEIINDPRFTEIKASVQDYFIKCTQKILKVNDNKS